MGKPGRPASVSIYPGKYFGFLCCVRKVHTKEGPRYDMRCEAKLRDQSTCGKTIRTKMQYLTRKPNPQTHCGCQKFIDANPYPYEKVCWSMMHTRCEYTGHVSYKDYGGRGIKICERWHKSNPDGFKNFLEDMGPAPKAHEFTVDRIDPDGNYELRKADGTLQCRWADKKTQANNQRRHKARSKVIFDDAGNPIGHTKAGGGS